MRLYFLLLMAFADFLVFVEGMTLESLREDRPSDTLNNAMNMMTSSIRTKVQSTQGEASEALKKRAEALKTMRYGGIAKEGFGYLSHDDLHHALILKRKGEDEKVSKVVEDIIKGTPVGKEDVEKVFSLLTALKVVREGEKGALRAF
mmetsp:Transcript_26879/g.69107  ORF Transcript_26879/g.69107 Transcript_26879/m.69107 type:complete len:147 (-) Transcript_26879:1598-2038(-)